MLVELKRRGAKEEGKAMAEDTVRVMLKDVVEAEVEAGIFTSEVTPPNSGQRYPQKINRESRMDVQTQQIPRTKEGGHQEQLNEILQLWAQWMPNHRMTAYPQLPWVPLRKSKTKISVVIPLLLAKVCQGGNESMHCNRHAVTR
jgi:hypothetical protein